MEHISDIERRRAFSRWLRTGQLTSIRGPDGVERKFNPWHDPDTGRFTFANTGVYHARGGGGGEARSDETRAASDAKRESSSTDDIVITAQRQTVDDVRSLSADEFDAFESVAKAGQWTEPRENREIHEYARSKRAVAARAAREKRGERDWAQQIKDFGHLYSRTRLRSGARRPRSIERPRTASGGLFVSMDTKAAPTRSISTARLVYVLRPRQRIRCVDSPRRCERIMQSDGGTCPTRPRREKL